MHLSEQDMITNLSFIKQIIIIAERKTELGPGNASILTLHTAKMSKPISLQNS